MGLAQWLRLNYPKKTVLTLGEDAHNFKMYEAMSVVEVLPKFLAKAIFCSFHICFLIVI